MTTRESASLSGTGKARDKKLLILMLAMFAAGFGLLAYGIYELQGALASRGWPQTEGSIIAASINKRSHRDSDHRTRIAYFPQVRYRYLVNGRPYTSTRIEFGMGESGGRQEWAQKVVNRYPLGKNVVVHYKSQDPSYAVLEVGLSWRSLALAAGGVCFLGAGFLCLATAVKASSCPSRNEEESL